MTKRETVQPLIELTVKPDDKDPFRNKQQVAVSGEEGKPPKNIPIDMSPTLYQTIKTNILKKQHPVVRPHLHEFFKWLKNLDALSVYDALEKGETVKERYEALRFNPMRITVAAARGLLKASGRLRGKADKALNLEIARLVLRFENPKVNEVLRQFDTDEEFLIQNIHATKQILGLVEAD